MADIELVEKLREKASVTYDEAREALDSCNDDLLDAIIYLERKGKVPPPGSGGSFNSRHENSENTGDAPHKSYKYENTGSFSSSVRKFFKWVGVLIKKSCVNTIEVWREGKILLSLPVLLLVVFIVCFFWATAPLLILGLFFDCRYKFRGPETENLGINEIIEDVANAADSLKNEIKNSQQHKDQE